MKGQTTKGLPASLVNALEVLGALRCGSCGGFGVLGSTGTRKRDIGQAAEVWAFAPAIGERPGLLCTGCIRLELQKLTDDTTDARAFRSAVDERRIIARGASQAAP